MGSAFFYHLTRRPMEETLAMLLEKAHAVGWPVMVRGTDPARMAWLDEKLWLGPEDGFLPHGLEGGPHDALQPILLGTGTGDTNAARCLMSVDGAEVTATEVDTLERVCVLFDGADTEALARARSQWKALKDAGARAQYWSEDSGRWEKKAET
ncbi:DNA polymerase III subunit chi [Sulfitobacter sp. D35]|uniref:DNA polymerase III subunit chi n=1 Tax=Sulfitobacter sp. D35 TaxID=3083252 RepID=UPI00296F9E98|nr:DNA polymerase III subunit chi [Sulfitobacter sp. D35]MDW4497628.1 DNA polymerase III subunit chi [Sulfitobacter sp. D35]